ncbi:MAG: EamA family transporter [Muribaculaceae bacterium]|nr:EamA family transporter [Muribaculaceae bacterium]
MIRLLILAVIQSLALSCGQLTLKIALDKMPRFGWTREFWTDLLTNWWFLLCGLLFGGASILWAYILKHFPLSQAAPMVSMSYVFTLVLAIMFLHEDVSWNRWLGAGFVILGCLFLSGK